MAKEILYRASNIAIGYNSDENWLFAKWMGVQNFDDIKTGGLKMLELLKAKNANKVLNDNSEVKGTFAEGADWAAKEWLPKMVEAGLKHFAWILSPSTLSQMSAQTLVDAGKERNDDPIQTFADFDSAKEWLRSV